LLLTHPIAMSPVGDDTFQNANNNLSQKILGENDDLALEAKSVGQSFLPALVTVLACLASPPDGPQRKTRFHSIRVPPLSLHHYVTRIAKYFQCSNECFVICIVYISRIVRLNPDFRICNLNIHRLVLTSIMIAAKFFDDVYYSNAYYAKVGGVRTKEVNALEAEFLQLIRWKLFISPQEFNLYHDEVYKAHNVTSDNLTIETKQPQRLIIGNTGVDEELPVLGEQTCVVNEINL